MNYLAARMISPGDEGHCCVVALRMMVFVGVERHDYFLICLWLCGRIFYNKLLSGNAIRIFGGRVVGFSEFYVFMVGKGLFGLVRNVGMGFNPFKPSCVVLVACLKHVGHLVVGISATS